MTSVFLRRTSSAYASHRKRARAALGLHALPYTLEEFREWWNQQIGDQVIARCCYCNTLLSDYDLYCDHAVPLNRGGSAALANLRPCCARDNEIKGRMTENEYKDLLALLDRMPVARADVMARLRAGAGRHMRAGR